MAFDPLLDASGGFLSPYLNPRRTTPIVPPVPGIQAYFNGVDQAQAARQAQQNAVPPAPTSQTTPQLPAQLPGSNPTDSAGLIGGVPALPDIGLPPSPAVPTQAPPGFADALTDPSAVAAQKYQLPTALPFSGPTGSTDPAAFAALDFLPPTSNGPAPAPSNAAPSQGNPGFGTRENANQDPQQAYGGTLTKEQLDRQFALMVGGESGGRLDAENGKTHALGLTQFMPKTLAGFLSSPEGQGHTVDEFRKSPELQRQAFDWLTNQNAGTISRMTGVAPTEASLAAAHALGAGGAAALLRNPNENAIQAYNENVGAKNGQTALIDNNAPWRITKDDTSAQALAKIDAYYKSKAGKQGSQTATPAGQTTSSPSDPATPTSTPGSSATPPVTKDTPSSLPGSGPDQVGPDGAMPAGYQPVTASDKMLALAGGILQGGPGLGGLANGLGKGISSMQKLGIDDQTQRYKIVQEAANTALLKQKLGLITAQTGAIGTKLDQGQQGLNIRQQTADTRDRQVDGNLQLGQGRLSTMQDRTRIAQSNADALNSGDRQFAAARSKDDVLVSQGLSNDVVGAGNDLQKIADLKGLLAKGGITGNDFVTEFKRWSADRLGLDVGIDPNTNSLVAKNMADFNSSAVLGQAKGMVSRLTQGEFNTLRTGIANMGTRPEALSAMLDTYAAAAKRRLELGMKFNQMAESDPHEFSRVRSTPGGLRGWYTKELGDQLVSRGITPEQGQEAPGQYQQNPQGQWQHRDTSGLGFTVH